MQRLFSTFPDGWPGTGLLLLRACAAIPLILFGMGGLTSFDNPLRLALRLTSVAGGVLLLAGLWTPIAGALAGLAELWNAFSPQLALPDDRWGHLLLGILAAAIAMIGPGAWSIDSRLFGRRRFEINRSD